MGRWGSCVGASTGAAMYRSPQGVLEYQNRQTWRTITRTSTPMKSAEVIHSPRRYHIHRRLLADTARFTTHKRLRHTPSVRDRQCWHYNRSVKTTTCSQRCQHYHYLSIRNAKYANWGSLAPTSCVAEYEQIQQAAGFGLNQKVRVEYETAPSPPLVSSTKIFKRPSVSHCHQLSTQVKLSHFMCPAQPQCH